MALNGTEREPLLRWGESAPSPSLGTDVAMTVMLLDMTTCLDCSGSRAVPDIFGDLVACPMCVIDAGSTFVAYEEDEEPLR